MYGNILILSSNVTGYGHKSIADSLLEQFAYYPDVHVKVVDGFSLGGRLGLKAGKMYGSITRTSKDAWKIIWDITKKKPAIITELSELTIQERFIRLLHEFMPDAIITTHPNYNASVTNILSGLGSKIPLYAIVADPVTISPLWCNPMADYTICPTEEAKETCLNHGVPQERIKVFGFPVRQRFTRHLCNTGGTIEIGCADSIRTPGSTLKFMIMSGGEGSGNMNRIAGILLKNFNCTLKIICGRNKLLKKRLEHTLAGKYPGRIEIMGFTENIQELMMEMDILFARASPNTMMEAVMCNVPMIITGALPGQEEGNPAFAGKHSLGMVCTDPAFLKDAIHVLMQNNFEKWMDIKRAQIKYRNPNSAKDIVSFIMSSS